ESYPEKVALVIAVALPEIKEKIVRKIKNPNIYFPSLIHPSVIRGNERHIQIGEGSLITAGNILTTNIRIGRHVLINLACTIGHDVVMEDFVSVMPGVHVSGEVHVGKKVFIGTGAQIINQLIIGEHTTIGAGATVCRNLPPHCTAVGTPAKPVKFHRSAQ